MPETISMVINGVESRVAPGTTVAAAMLVARRPARVSVGGEARGALCGMGICFECRATVNGLAHRRTCQLLCEPGMRVETGR